jgi:Photosynthesis system II assembly factor YCF48
MNEDYLLDSVAIDGTPAQAFASHKTRASAIARQYASDNTLNTIASTANEDNTIQLIAHLQAVSDDPDFHPKGQEMPSRTLAPKMLRNLNKGDGAVGTTVDEDEGTFLGFGYHVDGRPGDYDPALKELMVIAYRYRNLLIDPDDPGFNFIDFILDNLVPSYLPGADVTTFEKYDIHIKFKAIITIPIISFPKDSPETENHMLLISSTVYLVNQLFWDRTSNEKYHNGKNGLTKWLLRYMHTIAKHDFLEFNARPYTRYSLHALLNLHEFARDKSIRDAAQILLDYTMVKFAVSSNRQRRICPFRRLKVETNRPDKHNDLLASGVAGNDAVVAFFLMYAGPTDPNGNPINRFPWVRGEEALMAGLAAYRPAPAAYILAMKQDIPAFQHRFYHGARPQVPASGEQAEGGVEIYYKSPSFLLSAGGMFLNSGYGHDEYTKYKQTAIAQSTTLLPSRADVKFADLIRFDPYPDERRAVNTGVHLGFACGANLRPIESKIFDDTSTHAPVVATHGGQLFLSWKGSGNQNLNTACVYTTDVLGMDGIEGLEGKVTLGDTSEQSPALASHNGRLFLAYKGAGNDNLYLLFSDDNGASFKGTTIFPETSHQSPTIASHGGHLYLAWTGRGDGNLNVAKVTLFGNTAGGFGIEGLEGKVTLGDTSEQSPALASHNGRLFLAYKGAGNDNLYLLSSRDGLFQSGPWYFSDLSRFGFYFAAYRTAPAQPERLDTPLDSLGLLYAMEADSMDFETFKQRTLERNNTLPANLEYGGHYVFDTADNHRFSFWLHPSLEKYQPRIVRMDDTNPGADLSSLPLVDGPYLRTPNGHDGYIEIRYPGCETPLVLDFRDPENPVRVDNLLSCPQPLVATPFWNVQNAPPLQFSKVAFVNSWSGIVVGENGIIATTTNGGINWNERNSETKVTLRDVAAIGLKHAWVVGDNGTILSTTDGGVTFTTRNSGTNQLLEAVTFVSLDKGWVVGTLGTILSTNDGGFTWVDQTKNNADPGRNDLIDVVFLDENTGWLVGSAGIILHTTDGGNTWMVQESGTQVQLFGVAFPDTSNGYAVGRDNTIVATKDGGRSWMPPTIQCRLHNHLLRRIIYR